MADDVDVKGRPLTEAQLAHRRKMARRRLVIGYWLLQASPSRDAMEAHRLASEQLAEWREEAARLPGSNLPPVPFQGLGTVTAAEPLKKIVRRRAADRIREGETRETPAANFDFTLDDVWRLAIAEGRA